MPGSPQRALKLAGIVTAVQTTAVLLATRAVAAPSPSPPGSPSPSPSMRNLSGENLPQPFNSAMTNCALQQGLP